MSLRFEKPYKHGRKQGLCTVNQLHHIKEVV